MATTTTTPNPSAIPPTSSLPNDGSPEPSLRPSIAQSNPDQQAAARRSSFNFLRGSSNRSTSGGKMSKKQKALAQEDALRRQREAALLPKQPPRLPSHSALPQIDTFGGDSPRPDSVAIVSNQAASHPGHSSHNSHNFSRPSVDRGSRMPSMPNPNLAAASPMPSSSPSYMDYDPYPRTESMTHRGRYSYASSQHSTVNSPRRVRRRKDPTPFKSVTLFTTNTRPS